jgi:hypothetical protein
MEITITRKDYFKFISKICLKYCDWVRNGSLYDIGYSNDSYYSSDNLELISKGNMYKNITSFKTVSEWISECYVGNNYDTFYDYVRENINFEGIIYEKMNITEDDEIYEELIESDEVFDVGYSIECVVMDYFDEMTTLQCWNDYKDYK